MHYYVVTTSVHTTASICDYLDERATADDTVTVVAVSPAGDSDARRDAQEALNVAPVRLATVDSVRTDHLELQADEPPARPLLEMATTAEADEILVTAGEGLSKTASDVSPLVESLLENASRPVVVLPAPEL